MFQFIEWLTRSAAWLQIVASPLLIGAGIGVLLYVAYPGETGKLVAICIASAGLVAGVWWANKVRKSRGTVEFMSRVIATPELDKREAEEGSRK